LSIFNQSQTVTTLHVQIQIPEQQKNAKMLNSTLKWKTQTHKKKNDDQVYKHWNRPCVEFCTDSVEKTSSPNGMTSRHNIYTGRFEQTEKKKLKTKKKTFADT